MRSLSIHWLGGTPPFRAQRREPDHNDSVILPGTQDRKPVSIELDDCPTRQPGDGASSDLAPLACRESGKADRTRGLGVTDSPQGSRCAGGWSPASNS